MNMPNEVLASGHEGAASYMPSVLNQISFFVTGGVAGASTLPIEYAW